MTDTATAVAGRIVSIRLPEARTPELDGNMRSWGRSGERPEAVLRDRAAEMEAGR